MAIQAGTANRTDLVQLITFSIETEEYGISIADVIEIIRLPQVQRLPKAPDFLKGIINLRGEVVPIVELRQRFGLKVKEENINKRTIIVKVNNQKIGMIVDSVSKVIRVSASEIKDPPNFSALIGSEYINGIIMLESRMVIMLNIGLIFTSEEINHLSQATDEGSIDIKSKVNGDAINV